MFLLVKAVAIMVYPLGASLLLATGGLVLASSKNKKRSVWGSKLLVLSLVVLYLASNGLTAELLSKSLERSVVRPQAIEPADVVVVLGGGVQACLNPRESVEVNEAGDRILTAARLYRRGLVKSVVCSGGSGQRGRFGQHSEADSMAELLMELGVKQEHIIVERKSRTTHENAVEFFRLPEAKALRSIVLVTSASHMPRAIRCFVSEAARSAAVVDAVVPWPCDYAAVDETGREQGIGDYIKFLLPTAGALGCTTRMLHEYYGLLFYLVMGWI